MHGMLLTTLSCDAAVLHKQMPRVNLSHAPGEVTVVATITLSHVALLLVGKGDFLCDGETTHLSSLPGS